MAQAQRQRVPGVGEQAVGAVGDDRQPDGQQDEGGQDRQRHSLPQRGEEAGALPQQTQEEVEIDDDVALAHEGREHAHGIQEETPLALDQQQGERDQEETRRVRHPVLVLVPADGALCQAEQQQPCHPQRHVEAELAQEDPGREQEAEQEDVGDQPEGEVLAEPGAGERARRHGHEKAPGVGALTRQRALALGVARHLDVAPLVRLLDLLGLVQEAEVVRDVEDVDAQDEQSDEGPQARVA